MPRYPQGVTSFIPSYQAYQPDFTMMGKMLSIRQNQYDQNWKKLNDVYGSLLYADTTHEQSQEVKDQLKNEIDFNLRRVSGLDLSLEKNVQSAQQVFQPFYENSSLMYDMAATKNINATKAKGDSYKNSTDPEISGLYWNEGMDEINYRIQEFQETPYDQIQSTGLAGVKYTAHYNLGKEALAMMENIEPIKIPSTTADGKYDIVTTNGSQITGYLEQLFKANLGEDPRFQAMYKTEAYVNRKNYMNSNASKFNGDKSAAEREYLEASYKVLAQNAVNNKSKAKSNSDAIKKQTEIMTNPNSEYVEGEEKVMQELAQQAQISQLNLNKATVDSDMVSPANNQGQENPFENIDILRNKVDYLNANAIMQKRIGEQAQMLAYSGYEKEVSLNEEYKIRLEDDLAKQRDMMNARVKAGTHTYKTDSSGNVTGIEALPGVDGYIKQTDLDVTADETNYKDLIDQNQRSQFDDIKSYLDFGLNLVQDLGIDKIEGGAEDILRIIGADQEGSKIKSIGDLRNIISNYDTYKEAQTKGDINYTKLHDVSSNIRKIIFGAGTTGKPDYSKVLDKLYPSKSTERARINQWLSNSFENADNVDEAIANKNYLKTKTREIVVKGQGMPKTELFASQFAVDANGNGVGQEQYIRNVSEYIKDDYIESYLSRMKVDKDTEARIRAEGAKLFDKYSWYDLRQLTQTLPKYMSAVFNTYKIKDIGTFFTEYLDPTDWGKYELNEEAKIAWDMPDYEDVMETFDNEFKKSDNFKDASPSLQGGGTGTSGVSVKGTVVKGADYTQNFQEFYGTGKTNVGIANDIQTMMEAPDKTIYSAFGTSLDANDEDVNTKKHQKAVKFILQQVINPTNNEEIGNFDITIKPGTQFDGAKAAYNIKLSQDVLNKYVQKADSDGILTNVGVESAEILKSLYTNGLTIISDQGLLNSDAWEKGTSDAIASNLRYALQVKRATEKTDNAEVSRTQDLGGGFKIKYTLDGNQNRESYSMQTTVKKFNLEHFLRTGEAKTLTIPLANLNPQSLTQNRRMFIEGNMQDLKNANSQIIPQVKAAIKALKAQNPNITQQEIYNRLKPIYGE